MPAQCITSVSYTHLDAQNLDEVVVVGYGTAKKSDLTGATASFRPDANDASKAVSIDGLLQGKIAGLNVTASMSTPCLLYTSRCV